MKGAANVKMMWHPANESEKKKSLSSDFEIITHTTKISSVKLIIDVTH